jgi:hypothetical protein
MTTSAGAKLVPPRCREPTATPRYPHDNLSDAGRGHHDRIALSPSSASLSCEGHSLERPAHRTGSWGREGLWLVPCRILFSWFEFAFADWTQPSLNPTDPSLLNLQKSHGPLATLARGSISIPDLSGVVSFHRTDPMGRSSMRRIRTGSGPRWNFRARRCRMRSDSVARFL